jgi:ABC-type polysaccharide/polyol phosphate export permease
MLAFFQHGLYYHTPPSGGVWLGAAGFAVGTLVVGYCVYKRCEHEYIFRL